MNPKLRLNNTQSIAILAGLAIVVCAGVVGGVCNAVQR